jgi:hypothetical protein
MYHLDCVVNDFEGRRAKVEFYESVEGEHLLEDGRSINDVYYLPERHMRTEPVAVPPADRALIRSVLGAGQDDRIIGRAEASRPGARLLPGLATYDSIISSWPECPFPQSAYRASVHWQGIGRTPHRDLSRFWVGEARDTTVVVRNEGTRAWARGFRGPGAGLALAARWRPVDPDGRPLDGGWIDGVPVAFTADVDPGTEAMQRIIVRAPDVPGRYEMVVDVVHLNVQWFDGGSPIIVDVVVPNP